MVRKIVLMVTAILLTMSMASCSIKSPYDEESRGTVDVYNEETGELTTMDARVYQRQLEAQVIADCREYANANMVNSWAAVDKLDGAAKLTAIIGNQWKEAMIATNGTDFCKPGTNEHDAYIAYAEAQGKVYEVVIAETGKTLRFGAGVAASAYAIDSIVGAVGDRVGGNKVNAGTNASLADGGSTIDQESVESRSDDNRSATQVGTADSTIQDPNQNLPEQEEEEQQEEVDLGDEELEEVEE
jgi:hypothetical protein